MTPPRPACSTSPAARGPRSGDLLSSREDETAFVVTVSDPLLEALASATPAVPIEVGTNRATSEELWPYDDGDACPTA